MSTPDEIRRAGTLLRNGGVVGFPTETVYGLGANALDPQAVDRVFRIKGRPATSPLIVHVDCIAMAQSIVSQWSGKAELLAQRFWPGPLTLVLPKQDSVPDRVTAGLQTVGVRLPAHPVAQSLITFAGVPVAAPSANRFTEVSPTTASHVLSSLGDRIDMMLDGGASSIGIESTVLSLVDEKSPILLRPGHIRRGELESVIGPIGLYIAGEGPQPAPGLHPRHYSPNTPLYLTRDLPEGRGVYLWRLTPLSAAKAIQMPDTPARYASMLYSLLRELDLQFWEYIAVEPLPNTDEWAGINDRLARAATK